MVTSAHVCNQAARGRIWRGISMSNVNLQGLLHDSLVATGHVECCTIIGRRDGAVKASSAGYEVWWTHPCLPHEAVKLPPPSATLSHPHTHHTHTHTPTHTPHSPLLSRWMHSFPPLGRQVQLWIVAFTSMEPSISVCGLTRTPFMPERQVVSLTTLCVWCYCG